MRVDQSKELSRATLWVRTRLLYKVWSPPCVLRHCLRSQHNASHISHVTGILPHFVRTWKSALSFFELFVHCTFLFSCLVGFSGRWLEAHISVFIATLARLETCESKSLREGGFGSRQRLFVLLSNIIFVQQSKVFFELRTTFSRQPVFGSFWDNFTFFDVTVKSGHLVLQSRVLLHSLVFSARLTSADIPPSVDLGASVKRNAWMNHDKKVVAHQMSVIATLPQKVVEEEQLHTLGMSRTCCHLVEET